MIKNKIQISNGIAKFIAEKGYEKKLAKMSDEKITEKNIKSSMEDIEKLKALEKSANVQLEAVLKKTGAEEVISQVKEFIGKIAECRLSINKKAEAFKKERKLNIVNQAVEKLLEETDKNFESEIITLIKGKSSIDAIAIDVSNFVNLEVANYVAKQKRISHNRKILQEKFDGYGEIWDRPEYLEGDLSQSITIVEHKIKKLEDNLKKKLERKEEDKKKLQDKEEISEKPVQESMPYEEPEKKLEVSHKKLFTINVRCRKSDLEQIKQFIKALGLTCASAEVKFKENSLKKKIYNLAMKLYGEDGWYQELMKIDENIIELNDEELTIIYKKLCERKPQ